MNVRYTVVDPDGFVGVVWEAADDDEAKWTVENEHGRQYPILEHTYRVVETLYRVPDDERVGFPPRSPLERWHEVGMVAVEVRDPLLDSCIDRLGVHRWAVPEGEYGLVDALCGPSIREEDGGLVTYDVCLVCGTILRHTTRCTNEVHGNGDECQQAIFDVGRLRSFVAEHRDIVKDIATRYPDSRFAKILES